MGPALPMRRAFCGAGGGDTSFRLRLSRPSICARLPREAQFGGRREGHKLDTRAGNAGRASLRRLARSRHGGRAALAALLPRARRGDEALERSGAVARRAGQSGAGGNRRRGGRWPKRSSSAAASSARRMWACARSGPNSWSSAPRSSTGNVIAVICLRGLPQVGREPGRGRPRGDEHLREMRRHRDRARPPDPRGVWLPGRRAPQRLVPDPGDPGVPRSRLRRAGAARQPDPPPSSAPISARGFVTTDLPVAYDEPYEFGVQDYCMSCNLCRNNCPGDAIPDGYITTDGIKRWLTDIGQVLPDLALPRGLLPYLRRCLPLHLQGERRRGEARRVSAST